ncbi:MAG: hypothetical protein HQ503_11690 [Rhodospirillales bacterium]|nr:hypothetical protein [Rhodospirillales bacterium]
MRGFIAGLLLGLIAGVMLAMIDIGGRSIPHGTTGNGILRGAKSAPTVQWRFTSLFPQFMPHAGARVQSIVRSLNNSTDGRVTLKVFEPGQLVDALDTFDAVASGVLDAAFTSASYWGEKSPVFEMFGGIPFGPDINTLIAWFNTGGGHRFYNELYHSFNIHAVVCGVNGSTGGWFTNEIKKVEDFKDLKLAVVGLPARVAEVFGAKPITMAPSDLSGAFRSHQISGAIVISPADDKSLNFYRQTAYYYFPGWSRQSGFLDLMINLDKWKALEPQLKERVETVCAANVAASLSEGESLHFDALKDLILEGVKVQRWPAVMIADLHTAWVHVSNTLSRSNPLFREVTGSLKRFRDDRSIWRDLRSVDGDHAPTR